MIGGGAYVASTGTPSHGDLRVNILVSRERAGFHIDTVDLYSAKQRTTFIKQIAIEIGVGDDTVKKELGAVLLELEARVDEQIRAKLAPVETKPLMTEAERNEALALLGDPKLVDRIVADLGTCGLVGEESNKLLGYLAAVSRKLEEPLAIVVQSSSAAGKSSLMDAVLDMVPPEERVSFSAMTGQSLYYMGERDLRHKVLAIAEGEGADRASYPLKLLQSEGHLTIASTGKDAIDRQARGARVHGDRPGRDVPHHGRHRPRRRAVEPLPRAHGGRGPRPDPPCPREAEDRPDSRRHSRSP